MSIFALEKSAMTRATAATSGTADDVRNADGADAMSLLGSALPGSTISSISGDIGTAWNTGVDKWADDVADFSQSLHSLTGDASATDDGSCGFFGRLLGTC